VKLVIQIALGVFLGALASQLVTDAWRSLNAQQAREAERQKLAAEESAREEQTKRASELIMRQFQGKIQEDQARHAPAKQDSKQAQQK